MKDNCIVFGLGKDWKENIEFILEKFNVIACTDNNKIPEEGFWKSHYIFPDEINKYDFDKILICTRRFRDTIKVQLTKMGIPLDKIVYIESPAYNTSNINFKNVIQDMELYQNMNTDEKFSVVEDSLLFITEDKSANAGNPCQHYFAQDIWGANKIYHRNPEQHYDIGSRLDGFIAHLLVFRKVNYIDIRPLPYEIPNLYFVKGDAVSLAEFEDESIESLSCFHALEHFGLGRYGDKIDPDAYKKAAGNIKRVLKKGGSLYIGVPIGEEDKLFFNAHRVFSISTILSSFDGLKLNDFAIIEPNGVYAKKADIRELKEIKEYSCGLFEFEKIN